jgi:hypothetical protein
MTPFAKKVYKAVLNILERDFGLPWFLRHLFGANLILAGFWLGLLLTLSHLYFKGLAGKRIFFYLNLCGGDF